MKNLVRYSLLCLLLSSCSVLERVVERPQVNLANIYMDNMTLTGAELVLDLQIDNPNGFDLEIQGMDYNLNINGHDVATGENKQKLKLRANGKSQVTIPVAFHYQQIFNSISQVLTEKSLSYSLRGSTDWGLFQVPFSSSGEFLFKTK